MPVIENGKAVLKDLDGGLKLVPEEQAAEAVKRFGWSEATEADVTKDDKEKRSGGAANQILAGTEAGIATGAELASQMSRGAGEVDAMGNPTSFVEPVPAERIVPGAFTPEALERREVNPKAAFVGTLVPDLALAAIPGVGEAGWAARLGLGALRAGVSGAVAEAGQTVLEGDDFSAKDAAFYGLVGESLGALASGGIGRLMRTTGKEAPSALEVAALKATKVDADDALGELAASPLKAAKMADNATELTDRATTELAEHLDAVEQRLVSAETKAFNPANVKRLVSKNNVAQSEQLMSRGIELEDASKQLVQDAIAPEHSAFAQKLQDSVDELLAKRSSSDMYTTLRKVATELTEEAPENLPPYAKAVLNQLDESLEDEAVWGGIAKVQSQSRAAAAARGDFAAEVFGEGNVNRAKLEALFADGADRTQFTAYLDAAEAAAKGSADKRLRSAVTAAREAVGKGDDAVTSRLVRDTFADKATDFITNKAVKQALRFGLGAAGFHGGPVGALAGAAAGEFVAPAVSRFVEPFVRSGVEAAAPFVENVASRFAAEGVGPVLRKLAQSAATQVDTAGRSLSNAALRASQSTIGRLGAPTMSAGIARFMGSHDSLRSAYQEKREVLELVQRDPQALVDELSDSLGGLAEVAPKLHAALVAKNYQAVSFLRTKVPETIGVSISSPSGIPPSQLAIRQFALYYSGATDPSSVVEDIRNNRVRQEQIEALKAVWPEVYADLKSATLRGMSASKATPAQRMRMDLLFDFGPALDAGLSWSLALVMDAQNLQEGPRKQSAPRGRSTPSVRAQQPQGIQALANPQTMQV